MRMVQFVFSGKLASFNSQAYLLVSFSKRYALQYLFVYFLHTKKILILGII